VVHTKGYDKANEKNVSARPPACVRFVPRNTLRCSNLLLTRPPLDPPFLTGGLALTVTSMACLVRPVRRHAILDWREDVWPMMNIAEGREDIGGICN
jgi:hypothetical protein